MKKKDMIIGALFVLLGILIDQIVKIIIRVNMQEGDSFDIIKGFFRISHIENTGAAWGGFSGYTIVLIIVSIAILGFFIYMYKDINFKKKMVFSISLVLVISGTIGNLIDRLFFRSVTDFLDFIIFGYDFPVFNIADILLVVGFAIFIIDMIFLEKDDKDKNPISKDEALEAGFISEEEKISDESISEEELDDNIKNEIIDEEVKDEGNL